MTAGKVNKVQDVVIEQLAEFKIKNIYGYAGDTILSFFSALKNSPLNLYATKHESTAGLMASAEAKLTGKPAVCAVHGGPGVANIINGIADAASDRVPLLLLSGQVATHNIGTDYKQYINQQKLTSPLTVFSAQISNPESIVDLLYKALTASISRGGVSHLVIPIDLWSRETTAEARKFPEHLNQKMIPDPESLEKAGAKIDQSTKPVILYGRGIKNKRDQLIKLAEKINAALINTLPAAGIIEFDNPHTLGGLGHAGSEQSAQLLNESDLVIILGATWWPVDYTPGQPRTIQIDAVKENIGANHPVDIGIAGELKTSIESLIDMVEGKSNQEWKNRINEIRTEWFTQLEKATRNSRQQPLPPEKIFKIISENARADDVFTLDSGDNVIWFGKYFGNRCREIIISGTWRTMGFSLPAALAAKINLPETHITCITGDGGAAMVLAELLTARRYKIPVRIIVINNGCLAMEKNKMIAASLQQEEVDITNPDFVKLARSCGLNSSRAQSENELNNLLQQTRNLEQSYLIDVPAADYMPQGTKLK